MKLIPDRDRDAHGDVHALKGPDASSVEQTARRIPEIATDGIRTRLHTGQWLCR